MAFLNSGCYFSTVGTFQKSLPPNISLTLSASAEKPTISLYQSCLKKSSSRAGAQEAVCGKPCILLRPSHSFP